MNGFASARLRPRGAAAGAAVFAGPAPLALVALVCGACASVPAAPPVAPVAAELAPVLPPLPRACRDLLPLPTRQIGALHRLLRRASPGLSVAQRDCRAGEQWPIAYATGEAAGSGRAPYGFEVLRMTGDALLTFDERNRDSPTVMLCRVLDYTLDATHRLRAVALWDPSDERAFSPEQLDEASATLAWLELWSRAPSDCALGLREDDDDSGDPGLRERVRCAVQPLVLASVPACVQPEAFVPPAEEPDAEAVERSLGSTHRFLGRGRSQIAGPDGLGLKLERPEVCVHEPAPAARDVCLAEYGSPSGHRWYGRGDVTRSGAGGDKNYVDSYLTFIVLKRIEAERKAGAPAVAPGTAPPAAVAPPGKK